MIKGLLTTPKPCLKRVLIEQAKQPKFEQNNFVDLYTDKDPVVTEESAGHKLKLTLDFAIKMQYPTSFWQTPKKDKILEEKNIQFTKYQKDIKTLLQNSFLVAYKYTNKSAYLDFVASSTSAKIGKLEALAGNPAIDHAPISIANLVDYTAYDNGIPSIPYISIPKQITIMHQFGVWSNDSPSFLAYVFWINSGAESGVSPLPNTINSEIIFNGGKLQTQTGYFTIGNTFNYKGEERSLHETTTFSDTEKKDPATGFPLNAVKPTNLVERVNLYYGKPEDIWVGPIHMKLDSDIGKYRAMGGAKHNPNEPHPWLNYNIKPNNKLVDFRATSKLENMFSYNSDVYEKLLASSSDVLYTGLKKKNTIDEHVSNKAIVSEPFYSIRPTHKWLPNGSATTQKDNIHFLFAIDKVMLLKETTKLPGLLDKITIFGGLDNFVKKLEANLYHFEVIRINKTTGESVSLITSNNEKYFYDSSGGYMLRNKTGVINVGGKESISFYEFTDGGVDNSQYNNNTYAYKIKIKYKDPLIAFFSEKLIEARAVIKDLDELLTKTTLMIYDSYRQRFVNIYDKYQEQLNPLFVNDSLANNASSQLPFSPSFSGFSDNEIPNSIETAFPELTGQTVIEGVGEIDSLSDLLGIMNAYNDIEPVKEWFDSGEQGSLHMGYKMQKDLVDYIRNSLILSNTSPTLIQKVRSLIHLLAHRLQVALELYTTVAITKTDVGYTAKDSAKATQIKNAGNFTTEYEYTFKNSIDLSKTKNYLNWIGTKSHVDAGEDGFGGIKTIQAGSYAGLVRHNRDILLNEEFKNTVGAFKNFSYSFLPFNVTLPTMSLFNFNDTNWFEPIYLQTIRKRLYDRITNNSYPVLIPEILSFNGIRFTNDAIANIITDQDAYDSKKITTNLNIGDNFIIDFNEDGVPKGDIGKQNPAGFALTNNIPLPAFGSVENKNYEWQGGSQSKISNFSGEIPESIILIPAYLVQQRNIKFLQDIYNEVFNPTDDFFDVFTNKEVPFEVNLFSTTNVTNNSEQEDAYVNPSILHSMFNVNGNLNHYDYVTYILYLGLFGKVYYLDRFDSRPADEKLSPTSLLRRSLVNSFKWKPLSKNILDSLEGKQQILCRVQLFEGEDISAFFDRKVIDLFKNYYNYNEYFFITRTPAAIANADARKPKKLDIENRRLLERAPVRERLPQKDDANRQPITPDEIMRNERDRARAASRSGLDLRLKVDEKALEMLDSMRKRNRNARKNLEKINRKRKD